MRCNAASLSSNPQFFRRGFASETKIFCRFRPQLGSKHATIAETLEVLPRIGMFTAREVDPRESQLPIAGKSAWWPLLSIS